MYKVQSCELLIYLDKFWTTIYASEKKEPNLQLQIKFGIPLKVKIKSKIISSQFQ
jgi:hypothetical protein